MGWASKFQARDEPKPEGWGLMGQACKTQAQAALLGLEPNPSPGQASGSTHQ